MTQARGKKSWDDEGETGGMQQLARDCWPPPEAGRGSTVLQTPWYQISSLQNYGRIHSCLKPLSLCPCVIAALGYSPKYTSRYPMASLSCSMLFKPQQDSLAFPPALAALPPELLRACCLVPLSSLLRYQSFKGSSPWPLYTQKPCLTLHILLQYLPIEGKLHPLPPCKKES